MDNSAVKPIQLSGPVDCGNGKLQVWSFSEVAQTTFCNISGLPWTEAHLLLLGRLQPDSLNSGTSTRLFLLPTVPQSTTLRKLFRSKMHLVWSNYMPYLHLLSIKQYKTDRSLDFWWKHILTGRGRYDLGELLIGSMCLQCRQLQCYQCLILWPTHLTIFTCTWWYFKTFTCTCWDLTIFTCTCWYFTVCSRHSQPAGRCCWSLIEANWATTQEEVSYIIIITFHWSKFVSTSASI